MVEINKLEARNSSNRSSIMRVLTETTALLGSVIVTLTISKALYQKKDDIAARKQFTKGLRQLEHIMSKLEESDRTVKSL